jgi:hypothetical protein
LVKLSWRSAEPAGHSVQNENHEDTGPPAASPTSS